MSQTPLILCPQVRAAWSPQLVRKKQAPQQVVSLAKNQQVHQALVQDKKQALLHQAVAFLLAPAVLVRLLVFPQVLVQ